jgi:hypothetical protein
VSILIVLFGVPSALDYFAWFTYNQITGVKRTQEVFAIFVFHSIFLSVLAWGTVPYFSFRDTLSPKLRLVIFMVFWVLFLIYVGSSAYSIYTITHWEAIFGNDNLTVLSQHCKAMVIFLTTTFIMAMVLVAVVLRIENHEGLFPPCIEQMFLDFRTTTHWFRRFLCQRVDAGAQGGRSTVNSALDNDTAGPSQPLSV